MFLTVGCLGFDTPMVVPVGLFFSVLLNPWVRIVFSDLHFRSLELTSYIPWYIIVGISCWEIVCERRFYLLFRLSHTNTLWKRDIASCVP